MLGVPHWAFIGDRISLNSNPLVRLCSWVHNQTLLPCCHVVSSLDALSTAGALD